MAAGQLADPTGFVDILESYRVGGRPGAVVAMVLLIAGEAVGGAGLLFGRSSRRRAAATVALGVALAWTALATQAFLRHLSVDNCGCFGVYLGQSLRWWVLIEDIEFVALALWVRSKARAT